MTLTWKILMIMMMMMMTKNDALKKMSLMSKLRSLAIDRGDVKMVSIREYLCSSSISDCSPFVFLFVLPLNINKYQTNINKYQQISNKYQQSRRVEHPFPGCRNSLSPATFIDQEGQERRLGTSRLRKGKRKDLKLREGKLSFDNVSRVKLEVPFVSFPCFSFFFFILFFVFSVDCKRS